MTEMHLEALKSGTQNLKTKDFFTYNLSNSVDELIKMFILVYAYFLVSCSLSQFRKAH